MITRGGEIYVDATHASQHLDVSRGWFYRQYKPYLKAHKFGKHKRKYYALTELEALRDSVEIVEPAA